MWKRAATVLAWVVLGVFATPASVLAGGGAHCPDPLPEAEPTRVLVLDNCFAPGNLSVSTGDSVVWENRSTGIHTLTFGSLNAGDLSEGFTARFNSPGAFDYQCLYHPGMAGTVTVSGPAMGEVAIEPLSEIRSTSGYADPVPVAQSAGVTTTVDQGRPIQLRIGLTGGLIIAGAMILVALISAAASTVAVRRTRQ